MWVVGGGGKGGGGGGGEGGGGKGLEKFPPSLLLVLNERLRLYVGMFVCWYVLSWRAALELVRFVKLGGWQAMSFSLFHFFTVGWMGVMDGVLGAGCWVLDGG